MAGRQIRNPAKKGGITAADASTIANNQIHQQTFKSDYYQLMLRISTAVSGLRHGSPPPIVT